MHVPEDAWDRAAIPDHLRMKFRLVDDQGHEVAVGDDFPHLKRRYGGTGSQAFSHIPSHVLERDGITRWDFGPLPEAVVLERGGIRLRGYPALVDEGKGVAVRILDSEERAAAAQRAGLRRLISLHLAADMRYLRNNLPGLGRMLLQYAKAPAPADSDPADSRGTTKKGLGRKADLADELVALILELTFLEGQPPVRDQRSFERRLAESRPRLMTVAGEVCALAGRILEQYQTVRKRLSGITQINWMPSVMDMRVHMDALVFRGFLASVPYAHLREYPRYLKAIDVRAEKLMHAAAKDQQRMREMAPLRKRWEERVEAAREAGRTDPRLNEIRWMLEELRVSFFAQQLGTAYPVSTKRIEARWKELGL